MLLYNAKFIVLALALLTVAAFTSIPAAFACGIYYPSHIRIELHFTYRPDHPAGPIIVTDKATYLPGDSVITSGYLVVIVYQVWVTSCGFTYQTRIGQDDAPHFGSVTVHLNAPNYQSADFNGQQLDQILLQPGASGEFNFTAFNLPPSSLAPIGVTVPLSTLQYSATATINPYPYAPPDVALPWPWDSVTDASANFFVKVQAPASG